MYESHFRLQLRHVVEVFRVLIEGAVLFHRLEQGLEAVTVHRTGFWAVIAESELHLVVHVEELADELVVR